MSEPLAHLAFETTADERVDVAWRAAGQLTSVRTQRRLGAAIAVLLAAGLTFLLVRWLFQGASWLVPVAAAGLAAALCAHEVRSAHRRALRKVLAEVYGDGSCPFTVELHADRIVTDDGKHGLTIRWNEVHSVRETDGDLEIAGRGMLLVVRGRAFASRGEFDAFRQLAERLAADRPVPVSRG